MCRFEISINDECTVKEIQYEFSKNYQYLKIEFYRKATEENSPFGFADAIPGTMSLQFIRSNHRAGKIVIEPHRKVSHLKQILNDEFGLNSMIFRKAGSLWIETSLTNDWTLEKQNRAAFEISRLPVRTPLNMTTA